MSTANQSDLTEIKKMEIVSNLQKCIFNIPNLYLVLYIWKERGFYPFTKYILLLILVNRIFALTWV